MKHRTIIVRILMVWIVLAMSALACQVGTKATPSAGTANPTKGFVSVRPTLDQADAVQAYVPANGGEVTLKMKNGPTYDLSIPDNALAYGQVITITPLQKVDGMPFSGGLIGGVDLQPNGLFLYQPATLTIILPGGYNLGDRKLAGFAYHGDGQDFHLSSATGDGQKITLTINSFSGHGASSATNSEMDQQYNRSSSDLQSELDQLNTTDVGDDPAAAQAWKKQMDAVLGQMYAQIKALLKSAASDDSLANPATYGWLSWMQAVVRYGFEDFEPYKSEIETGTGLLTKALNYAFDQSASRCVSIPDLNELGNMLRIVHLMSMAGLSDSVGTRQMNAFTKCPNFHLSFTSTTTIKVNDEITVKVSATGDGNLDAKISGTLLNGGLNTNGYMVLSGKGKIQIIDYEIDMKGEVCHASLEGANGTLWLAGIYDYRGGWVNDDMLDNVGFTWTGLNQKVQSITCGSGNDQTSAPGLSTDLPAWAIAFSNIHKLAGEYHAELDSALGENGSATGDDTPLYFDLKPKSSNCVSALACVQKTYQGQVAGGDATDEVDLKIMVQPKP